MAYASPGSDWLSQLPTLSPGESLPPPAPAGIWANPVVSGVTSGFDTAVGNIGRAVQAGGAVFGSDAMQESGARVAAEGARRAAAAGRPDLEQQSILGSPGAFVYKLSQTLPTLAGAAATAEALPAIGGAGALATAARGGLFMLPQAVGQNVQEEQAQNPGELTRAGALKAIALGAPEALAQGFVPGRLEQILEKGAAGGLIHRAFTGGASLGAYQGVQAGATQALTDAAYHPELSFSERAKNVVDSALEGGISGAVFGGAIHVLGGQRLPDLPPNATIDDLDAATRSLEPQTPQLPAPAPLLQITDQRTSPGNIGTPTERPIAVNSAGEASTNPVDVIPGQTIYGGPAGVSTDVAAASRANATKALPAPELPVPDVTAPLAQVPSDQLKTLHDSLASQDKMDIAQVGQFAEVRQELAQRTVPGLKPGEGNLFTPEEVAARQPQVEALKASLDLPEKAQETPWFKNLNATTEPELINAIDAQLKTYDRVSKADATVDNPARKATKVPEWLQTLAESHGLMDDGKASSPAQKLEDLGVDKIQAEKTLDAATKVGGAQLRNANRNLAEINADIAKFAALDTSHQEALQQLADAKVPKDPVTGTSIAQPDLTVKARPEPTGLDAAAQAKWDIADAIVRGNFSDDIKKQALAHQESIEGGKSVTKQALMKLGSEAKKEAKSYSGADRSIVENANAVQERSPTGVDAREPPGDGGGVGSGDAARPAPAPRPEASTPTTDGSETHWDKFARENPPSQAVREKLGTNLAPKRPAGLEPNILPEKVAKPTPEEAAPKAAVKVKSTPAEDRVALQKVHDTEPDGSPRKDFAARALAGKDPLSIRIALNTLAKDEELQGRKASSLESPRSAADDWAAIHADNVHGDVVAHVDPDHALVRGFSATGKPVYVAANRGGARTVQDVRQTKVLIEPKAKEKLIAAANKADKEDAAAFAKKPDGPFTGDKGQVVGTPTADPRAVNLASEWAPQMGLGGVRILIAHPDDVRGAAGDNQNLKGPYNAARTAGLDLNDPGKFGHMRQFGPGSKDFYIYLKPGMDEARTTEVLAHEMGHIVQEVQFRNAPAETKAAIKSAYDAWVKSTGIMNGSDLIRSVRNRSFTEDQWDDKSPATTLDSASRRYFTSFPEWFADNVSRWATSAEKPRSVIEKFFAAVAQKLRDFMSVVTGNKFLPDAAVKDFMDKIGSAPDEQAFTNRVGTVGGHISEMAAGVAAKTPDEANERLKSAVKNLTPIWQKVSDSLSTLPTTLRRLALPGESFTGIVNIAGKYLKSAAPFHTGHELREARTNMKDKADSVSHRAYLALKPEGRKPVDAMLAKLQNPWVLDPRKSIGYYADKIAAEPQNADAIRALHKELVSDWSRLQQAGQHKIVESILSMNQTKGLQKNVAKMHAAVEMWEGKSGVKLFGDGYVNPDEMYRRMTAMHDDPAKTQEFYRASHDLMQKAIQDQVASSNDPLLKSVMDDVKDMKAMIDTGTYSPLKRESYDHFVSGRLATDEAGQPKPGAQQALSDAMQKAGFDIGMSYDPSSSVVMAKVKDKEAMKRLNDVLVGLEKAGHIETGSTKAGHPDDLATMHNVGTPFVQQMIANIRDTVERSNIDADSKDKLSRAMIAQLMDTVSDRSMLPSMQKRDFTSGYDPEMGKAAIMQAMNSSRASTAVSSRGEMARLTQAMKEEVNAAKGDRTLTPAQREIGHDAARELMRREAERAWHMPHSFVDTIKSGMHTLMVGANPAYTITAMSQIPTLLHPELAKQFGYGKSAVAIGKATGRAFKMMRAVYNSPDAAAVGFREDAQRKGGSSEKDIQTIMKLENAGKMTSFTQAMSELGEGTSPLRQKIKNWTNALGVYAEQLPRVIAALTAGDLYDQRPVAGKTRDQYVNDVVSNSQFNWGPGETSRLTSKKGPLGPATQISLAFMQYQTNMIQKLYTEMHAALGKDGVEAKKEAGKFLAAHLVNVIAISGTLGLPAAAFAAGAFDKIYQQLTGRDDMDIQGLYRTYMAHVFGPDVADVIAKGLPRALGVDLSKLGDANLIPGTGFMTDKRKWEDASKDWLKSMAGAGGSELGNLVLGSRDLMNGDYLQAAIKFAPEGLKGIAEGAYYSTHGYVDKDGVQLPIGTPSALDIVYATLGFDPARLAQYQEAKRIGSGLEAQRQFREQNISQHLVKAQMTGDSAALGTWLNAASQFQSEHLGMSSPLKNMRADFEKHLRGGVLARAIHAPIGVGVIDPNRASTGFLSEQ